MDEKIASFIASHHVMTLATCFDGQPWCANLFYTYLAKEGSLICTSNPSTRHIQQAIEQQGRVAVSIVLESKVVARLQGVQIEGQMHRTDEAIHRNCFLGHFPYAAPFLEPLWRIDILSAKYTDNTLGIGTKLIYHK
ncbi:MAG: pyridoxamine 5'-phosphate oxidase family protein [Mucinivorans sp.]